MRISLGRCLAFGVPLILLSAACNLGGSQAEEADGGGEDGLHGSGGGSSPGTGGSNGLGGTCAQALFGRYLLRTDGALLLEADDNEPAASTQLPVLKDSTGEVLTGVVAADQGRTHGCALVENPGTVWCWRSEVGGNAHGQLGNGTTDQSATALRATQVLTQADTPLTGVVSLSRSGSEDADSACAVTSGGVLYCWGDGTHLFNNGKARLDVTYATQVTTDGVTPFADVEQVAVGLTDACAVVRGAGANGKEVRCWGKNDFGQLGTGDEKKRQWPTRVAGLSSPQQVIVFGLAQKATCAIDGDAAQCWGSNGHAQLGNGTSKGSVGSPSRVAIPAAQVPAGGLLRLSAGKMSVCAHLSDHRAICWGQPTFAVLPAVYSSTGIASLGSLGADIKAVMHYLTEDGRYHIVTGAGVATVREPRCEGL